MKILVLQLKRIGDVILTTPVIRALRDSLPAAHLTMAIDSASAGLAPALTVDSVEIYRRGFGNAGFWRRITTAGYDVCLDFTGTDRSGLICAVTRARRRATFPKYYKRPLRFVFYTEWVKSSLKTRHVVDHYLDLLKVLGVERQNLALDLRVPATASADAARLLADAGVAGPYAIFHPGTARPEKYWPPGHWAEVITRLRAERRIEVVLTGAADPVEQAHLSSLNALLARPCVDFSGRTDLLTLTALIRGASFFCGVDTAAMHLASAMQTPTLALFGPTNPFHWGPRHARAVILRADTSEPFGPTQPGGPMSHLSAGEVSEKLPALAEDRLTPR